MTMKLFIRLCSLQLFLHSNICDISQLWFIRLCSLPIFLHSNICAISVTYLWHICDISVPYLWHICAISVTYLWYICDISVIYLWHICDISVTYLWHICDISVTYLCHICDISVIYLWHICDISVAYLWHICAISVTYRTLVYQVMQPAKASILDTLQSDRFFLLRSSSKNLHQFYLRSSFDYYSLYNFIIIETRDGHAPHFADAHRCAYTQIHIFSHIHALSASFWICRIRMAIPNWDTLLTGYSAQFLLFIIHQFLIITTKISHFHQCPERWGWPFSLMITIIIITTITTVWSIRTEIK